MVPEMKPVEPKTSRWEPTSNPNDIVVPGLNTTAPPYDQIEQIEQLITIKLQNIDANFSKIQHVMANRILPAVKKYGVGTQPVREAAKFWTTFYEQAAQIRIPAYEDYSAASEQREDETETTSDSGPAEPSLQSDSESDSATPSAHRTYTSDRTSSEVSFAPGQAAISSTPAAMMRTRMLKANANQSFASETSEPMPSWSASLESPLLQLNREIKSLSEDHSVTSTSVVGAFDASDDVTQRQIHPNPLLPSQEKGKGREGSQPLLHSVLRRNVNSSAVQSSSATSPLKFKPKTPVIKTLNPYLPPDSNPSDWKGLVDLKDPSVASPRRNVPGSAIKLTTFKPSAAIGLARARTKTPTPREDDSFDENFGMSPPVMTDYARLPKLGQTPKKVAAERIMQSLVDVERRSVFAPPGAVFQHAPRMVQVKGVGPGTEYGTESSMSSMLTPPSMTRYARMSYAPAAPSETSGSVADASLDSIMRRVGLNDSGYERKQTAPAPAPAAQPAFAPAPSKTPSSVFTSISSLTSIPTLPSSSSSSSRILQPLAPPEPIQTPDPPQYEYYDDEVIGRPAGDADDSMDSVDSMDSMDYDDPGAIQETDFLFATQEQPYDDEDSFDSSLDEDEELTDGTAPPFIVAPVDDDFDFDDSFDDAAYGDGEEETVFGAPPAQRLQQQAHAGSLRTLGEDLLQDTIGSQMALAGRVEESPTPWNNGKG